MVNGFTLFSFFHALFLHVKYFFFVRTAWSSTVQKMKFSIMDFFSKCDQIRSFLRIWSHLLKKSVMKNFIFCAVFLKYVWWGYFLNLFRFIVNTLSANPTNWSNTLNNSSAICWRSVWMCLTIVWYWRIKG